MEIAVDMLIVLISFLHIYFLILEMFFWQKPLGLKTFHHTPDFAAASRKLAANQGLYNGFLAAGLLWGVYLGKAGTDIKLFFLCCILIAGIYGGLTAIRKILLVQGLPAAIALLLLLFAGNEF